MVSLDQQKEQSELALFSYGFRPFFLFGSAYAGLAIPLWLVQIHYGVALESVFTPTDWHVHEMLYGFVPAIVAGFLLTAIPNWTGRLPISGVPLFALFSIWAAGRLAVYLSAKIGWLATAVFEVSFLLVIVAVAGREIVVGKNWRNLRVLAVVSIFAAGNLTFHLESHYLGSADYGTRLGISAIILLISLVGGRIVPSFTNNWLMRQKAGKLPASFGRIDVAAIVVSLIALLFWITLPYAQVTGYLLLGAGLVQFVRMARWRGERTAGEPIVVVLHIAYAFIPLGFILLGLSDVVDVPRSAGIHAWTGGAIGTMILAVTTRASLGHTGRVLIASAAVTMIYFLVVSSALMRIAAALVAESSQLMILLSGLAWAGAFLGFTIVYAPILCTPRR
jgi:uncharacterized protein involved in response to NO